MANCKHLECWADHKFAKPRCLICDPPPPGHLHIKGVRDGDRLVTAADITAEIEQANAAAIAARLRGWVPGRAVQGIVYTSSLAQKLIGNEFPATASEAPCQGVVATLGVGFCIDPEVEERAKAEYQSWLARQPKLPVVKSEKRQQVDRYVSPVKLEYSD